MVLWWIGAVILLVVVLPVVIYLLNRVLAAVERIRGATDDILAGGVALIGELDGLPEALDGGPDGFAVFDRLIAAMRASISRRAASPSSV